MVSQSQHRHLKDLLKEEQEPFLLQNQPLLSHRNLQLNKKLHQNASFPSRFCQNACFSSSFNNANSPLFSPAVAASKSSSRALFLHVPAKTAALLLEAAVRIQKNSPAPNPNPKPKIQLKSSGFALLGSVIRRLTNRSQIQKLRTQKTGDSNGGGDGDFIRWADSVKISATRRVENRVGLETVLVQKSDLGEDQMGVSNGRLSNVWSEENKSSSSFSSSSSSSRSGSGNLSEEEGEDEVGFVNALEKENGGNGDENFTFSLSPLSPFRFTLYKSTSPGRRSPAFCSPSVSPHRRKFEVHVNCEQDPSVNSQLQDEEKEQSSPASILDSPFGDDDCKEECKRRDEKHGFNTECSYAFVQRSKQHLLQKLRKFDALAGLDQDEDHYEELEYCKPNNDSDDHSSYPGIRRNIEGYLVDITRNSGVAQDLLRPGMKRLLYDLISEEERSAECSSSGDDYESVVKRVCKRLDCWKEVEPNTIDMMIGMDLRGKGDEWKKSREDISWTAKMLEVSIFAILVDELLDDLVS